VRLRREIKARGNCLAGHHEIGGRAVRGGRRGRKKSTRVGQRGGEDTSDKQGPVVRETRERRLARKGVNLDGPAGIISAYGDGTAGGLAGPEAKRAAGSAGPKGRKRISELKIGFSTLPRLWKFVEGDLGGILT
jgi:hypothetical protein